MQTQELKDLGIETKQAQTALAQFMRQGFSTKQAAKLADVARNAAIFSQEDTTATLERLIWGVQTRQIEVLRTAGINVSFEREFGRVMGLLDFMAKIVADRNGRGLSRLTHTVVSTLFLPVSFLK